MRWRPVTGWEGFYEVSDHGEVRSLDRYVDRETGPQRTIARTHYEGRILKVAGKYPMVSLTRPGAKRRYAYVHDLVTEAFIGPKPKGMEVCHGDGDRRNNDLPNLRYGTRKENRADSIRHGTDYVPKAFESKNCKLNPEQVQLIHDNPDRLSQRALGRVLGVTHSRIGAVMRGKAYFRK